MREEMLREITLEYEEQRRKNEMTEQRRREEIAGKFPEIAALTQERSQLIHGSLQDILRGSRPPENLEGRMETLSARIRAALRENGYPEDYLSPVYRCARCRDTGFVGELLREPCECVQKRLREKIRERIGLQENAQETFENFREDILSREKLPGSRYSQLDIARFARNTCEQWADSAPDGPVRDLLLTGKSGLGKTFLLRAMAARLTERGLPVLMVSAYDFIRAARRDAFGEDQDLEELLQAPILMIDDLGSEPLMQNISVEQLFRLVNERQNSRRSTVISTNLDLEEFRQRYTERVASRLTDVRSCRVVLLAGNDLRMQQR